MAGSDAEAKRPRFIRGGIHLDLPNCEISTEKADVCNVLAKNSANFAVMSRNEKTSLMDRHAEMEKYNV